MSSKTNNTDPWHHMMIKLRLSINFSVILVMIVVSHLSFAQSEPVHDTAQIREQARLFLEKKAKLQNLNEYKITVGKLDSRLRLHQCQKPLGNFLPNTQSLNGAVTVGIRCEDERPWTIYVRAQVRLFAQVIVAKHFLKKGILLGENDIRLAKKELTNFRQDAIKQADMAVGHILTRSVKAGAVVYARNLELPKSVLKGQKILLLAKTGGIEVRVQGKALSDGANGELIKVRNLSSNRIVEGRVVSPGVVTVSM